MHFLSVYTQKSVYGEGPALSNGLLCVLTISSFIFAGAQCKANIDSCLGLSKPAN